MKNPRTATAACLLAVTLLVGCQAVEEPVSDRDRAVDLLNHRQYEQAIVLLRKMVASEPTDHDSKILLATAYVGAVGFNVIDAYAVFEPMFFNNGTKAEAAGTALSLADVPVDAETATINKLSADAMSFLHEFTKSFHTVASVPHTPKGERGRLIESLALLKDIPENDPQAKKARAYSGVVNALQFFNVTRDTVSVQVEGRPATFLEIVCGLNVRGFIEDLELSSFYLLRSMTDFEAAYQAADGSVEKPFNAPLAQLRTSAEHAQEFYKSTPKLLDQAEVAFAARKSVYCSNH